MGSLIRDGWRRELGACSADGEFLSVSGGILLVLD